MDKELKKLNRRELVDVIYQMKKNEESMQEKIDSLQKELEDKRMKISNAGSIADASLDISQVFKSAQDAADIYLSEIENMKLETEQECARMIEEAQKKVKLIVSSGERQFDEINNRYKTLYDKWEQLLAEINSLQNTKKQIVCEDLENA